MTASVSPPVRPRQPEPVLEGAAGAAASQARAREFVRFTPWARFQHFAMMVLFTVLIVTGLPQKWPSLDFSQWLVDVLGGVFVARWWHRAAGLVFSVLLAIHVAHASAMVLRRKWDASMLMTLQDFRDAIAAMRWYLGRDAHPPRFGRYDFRQKFEYWGLVFGSIAMVFSGLLLLYPILFSRFLPAVLIPAAKTLHTNEAMLATLVILVWHLYGAHLNPDVFPADLTIFSGKISRERMHHEHPLELEEIERKEKETAAKTPRIS